jgi:hypothetical protein
MAQSHRYCDHPATKSARAKCRRTREQFGEDYTETDAGWGGGPGSYQPPPRQRRQAGPRRCPECSGLPPYHASWCSRHFSHRDQAWENLFRDFQPAQDQIVHNDNGGYKRTDRGKGRFDDSRDDQARSPISRRIVQLERKAASTSAHEAAVFMAAALRFRTREGLVGQVL